MLQKLKFTFALLASLAMTLPALAQPTTLPLPSINGPSIGDPLSNLYTFMQAYQTGAGYGSSGAITTISQTSGQANCTQLGTNSMMHQLKTSAGTGYVCLPTAQPGRIVRFANATGQNIDIYSSATSYTSGTADTINGTAGTTPYAGLTSSIAAVECWAPVGGAWYCSVPPNGGAQPGVFTTLSASSTVSGTGFSTYLASPPAIGGTAPAAGAFTTLTASGQITSTAGTPTIASGACGAATNGAIAAGSTNQSGEVTIGSATTTTCTISFSATLGTTPSAVLIFPANATAAATGTTVAYVSAITTGHFVITGSALASANYYYIVL